MIGNAFNIARIATSEEEVEKTDEDKDKGGVSLGRRGGKARAENMTTERRAEIANSAAYSRWKKDLESGA